MAKRWIRVIEIVENYAYTVWVIEGGQIVEDHLIHAKRDEILGLVEEKFKVKCSDWNEDWIWKRDRYIKVVDAICE